MNGTIVSERETALDSEVERFLPGIVCLVGGGGKTTLLFALADALAAPGVRVLCTTPTRMLLPRESARLAVRIGLPPGGPAFPEAGPLFAALPPATAQDAAAGKVRGYPAAVLDGYIADDPSLRILVEADGAAGRPVKAPAGHEPVLPRRTAAVIAVAGMRCMGEPLSGDAAFRPELVAAAAGLCPGDVITPAAVARLAAHPAGMFKDVPPGAARILFCNQSDLPGAGAAGRELAAEIVRQFPGFLQGFYCGSLLTKGLRCLSFPTC